MDIWEILGIARTTDLAVIRQAYAEKAKLFHPEEHPEEFQKLQRAFRMAEKYAKTQKKLTEQEAPVSKPAISDREKREPEDNCETEKVEVLSETSETEDNKKNAVYENGQSEKNFDYDKIELLNASDEFFREVVLVIRSPHLRNSICCWEIIFGKDEYAGILRVPEIRKRFLEIVGKQSGWKHRVLRYFEDLLKSNGGEQELKYFSFRLRKITSLFYFMGSKYSRRYRKEEKKLHKMVCGMLEKKRCDFKDAAQVEAYLEYYMPCAGYFDKKRKIEKVQKQVRLRGKVFGVLAFILALIFVWSLAQGLAKILERIFPQENTTDANQNIENYHEDYQKYQEEEYEKYYREAESLMRGEEPTEDVDESEGTRCRVYYIYNDEIYMIVQAYRGKTMPELTYMPEQNGYWDYDYSKPVEENMVILWKSSEEAEKAQ